MYKFVFLSILGLVASATVTPKKSSTEARLFRAGTSEPKAKQVFTTKTSLDGTPVQQCQCIEFHLCDRSEVFDASLNQNWIRCDNQIHVCCIFKGKEFDSNSPSVVDSSSPSIPIIDPEDQTADPLKNTKSTDNNNSCSCVPLNKCSEEGYENNYGKGSFGPLIRISATCDISEVCCANEYIIKTEVPVVVTETSTDLESLTSLSSDPVELTTESVYSPTQSPRSQCVCVSIDSCKNTSIKDNHGAGVIQIRAPFCDVLEVCCLVEDVVVVPPSEVTDRDSSSSPSPALPDQECGLRKGSLTRVTGVTDSTYTSFGEFPWMVMILLKGHEDNKPTIICGGSLISTSMVLTAAHCVHKIDKEKLIIRAGEYDYNMEPSKEEESHQDRNVHDIRIHPFYRADVVFNDMALLITDELFKLKSHISPICLPYLNSKFADRQIYDRTKCIATGWGKEVHGLEGAYQNTLKKVDIGLVSHHDCEMKLRETQLGSKFMLHSSFICAGGEPEKDTCQGDGGGPLFCALRENPNRYIQVGITSWGISCGKEYPGVYTNIFANSKWLTIEVNMATIFSRHANNSTE